MKTKNCVPVRHAINHSQSLFLLTVVCLCVAVIIGCNRDTTADEKRTVLHIPMGNTAEIVGSVSIISLSGGLVLYSTERPGDKLLFSPGTFGGGVSRPSICVGEGSEIRYSGEIHGDEFILTSDHGTRLCFRKVKDGWAFLCGAGRVEYPKSKKVFELGRHRTVNSCLALISSSDPILREGAARDLGRLASQDDVPRVVPRLAALLRDSSLNVRRGAAEGLGLIGRQECVSPLKDALHIEKDKTTQGFIAEALALCAGGVLVKSPSAPDMSSTEACKLLLSGATSWADEILAARVKSLAPDAITVLLQRLESPEACERLASLRLLATVKPPEAREPIRRLSEADADEEVKAKALEALQDFPRSPQEKTTGR